MNKIIKKKEKNKKKTSSNQSLAKIAQKILEPFKLKKKQKKLSKEQKYQLDKINDEYNIDYSLQNNTINSYEDFNQSNNSFFYSHDKFFNQFEDSKIINEIKTKYPKFDIEYGSEQTIRNIIIDILNDSNFIQSLLQNYDMTILDFFKFLFRCNSSIFKGLFIKRIKKAIKYKKYATYIKKSSSRQQHKKYKK